MERVKGSKEENLPKCYSLDGITNIRVNANNSAVFDNGHSSTECRTKGECKASTKKYDERAKPKFQVKDVFNSMFQVKEKVIANMPYKGRLKYKEEPEIETERGFEWKEADRNGKWNTEKQLSRNEKKEWLFWQQMHPHQYTQNGNKERHGKYSVRRIIIILQLII